jgi:hypothetical protein
MFSLNDLKISPSAVKPTPKPKPLQKLYPFDNSQFTPPMNACTIDSILENEKQHNKTETWNKLDNTVKMKKLISFANKYGNEHGYVSKDINSLITFFNECLEKKKLQKKKDLLYDKETYEIISIPLLHYNSVNHSFTLKNSDTKRVSTLKSLTPKRVTEKIHIESI